MQKLCRSSSDFKGVYNYASGIEDIHADNHTRAPSINAHNNAVN